MNEGPKYVILQIKYRSRPWTWHSNTILTMTALLVLHINGEITGTQIGHLIDKVKVCVSINTPSMPCRFVYALGFAPLLGYVATRHW